MWKCSKYFTPQLHDDGFYPHFDEEETEVKYQLKATQTVSR